jgi:TPR repeat protein
VTDGSARKPSALALAAIALNSALVVACVEGRPMRVDAPLLAAVEPRPQGCASAGIEVLDRGVPMKDPSPSAAALDEFCDRKHARPCMLLAEMYLAGCGVPADEARAAELFERACDLGEKMACGELALSSAGSSEERAELLTAGCNAGHARACRSLGTLIDQGPDVPGDARVAVELWEKGCRHGDAESCLRAGRAYEPGGVVTPNPDKAEQLVERACALGESRACIDAEQILVPASRPILPP